MSDPPAPRLIAYSLGARAAPRPLPAPRRRRWMDETEARWANRCLPMLMANEAGWVLPNSHGFTAVWDGGGSRDALRLDFDALDGRLPRPESHFGYGIITWTIPWLFRTPPGWNLMVRGPANWPKDGAAWLEGIVEADWSVATFTMNWKVTRADHPVRFEEGEPICMLVPMRRGVLESFAPELRDIGEDAELRDGFARYAESRHRLGVEKFLAQYSDDFKDSRLAWEQHYFRGVTPDGRSAVEHETRTRLAEFDPSSREAP